MDLPFSVRMSAIEGRGAFASRFIKKSEHICIMDGEEMTIEELKRRYASGAERDTDPLQVGDTLYIDLAEPYLYINHACEPNAAIVGRNELVAVRDIVPGEELTYDYSATDYPNDAHWDHEWAMACRCGSFRCRGEVREWPYLPKEVQERLIVEGRVPEYVAHKHARLGGARDAP